MLRIVDYGFGRTANGQVTEANLNLNDGGLVCYYLASRKLLLVEMTSRSRRIAVQFNFTLPQADPLTLLVLNRKCLAATIIAADNSSVDPTPAVSQRKRTESSRCVTHLRSTQRS